MTPLGRLAALSHLPAHSQPGSRTASHLTVIVGRATGMVTVFETERLVDREHNRLLYRFERLASLIAPS